MPNLGDIAKWGAQQAGGKDALACEQSGGTDVDACSKDAIKTGASIACDAGVTAAGVPILAHACGPLCGIIVDYAYPVAKALLIGTAQEIQTGIMSLLPSSLTAHAVYSPNIAALELWQGNVGCFDPACMKPPPLLDQWQNAVKSVQVAWDKGRRIMGLSPAPVSIESGYLLPIDPNDRLLVPAVSTRIEGAEACLRFWLDHYNQGWTVQKQCQQDLGNGEFADVWNTELPGTVEDFMIWHNDGKDNDVWIGAGPFGLKTNNWPSDCAVGNENLPPPYNVSVGCVGLFAQCVKDVWAYRIAALQKALPQVFGAVAAQITSDHDKPSTMVTIARVTVGTVVVGAVGYGIFRGVMWLIPKLS